MLVITSFLAPLSQQITARGDNEDRDCGGMWHWIPYFSLTRYHPPGDHTLCKSDTALI